MTSTVLDKLAGLSAPETTFLREQHPLASSIKAGHWRTVPDVIAHLVAGEDQISAAFRDLEPASEQAYTTMTRTVLDAVEAGDGLPENLAAVAADAAQAQEQHRLTLLTLQHLRNDIAGRWRKALRANADTMLDGLRYDLANLLAKIAAAGRKVDHLDLTDAEAIAGASKAQQTALLELRDLRSAYQRIRRQQADLLAAAWERPNAAGIGTETWIAVLRTQVHEFAKIPANGRASDETGPAWFRRLLHRDDVWLPTVEQLRAAFAETATHPQHEPAPQPGIRITPAPQGVVDGGHHGRNPAGRTAELFQH